MACRVHWNAGAESSAAGSCRLPMCPNLTLEESAVRLLLVVVLVVPELLFVLVVLAWPASVIGPPEPRKVCDQSRPRELVGLRLVSTNFTAIRTSFCG